MQGGVRTPPPPGCSSLVPKRSMNVLSALGMHKSDLEVVGLLARRLPSEFHDVEKQIIIVCFGPGITPLGKGGYSFATSYAERNTKALEARKSSGGGRVTGSPEAAGGRLEPLSIARLY